MKKCWVCEGVLSEDQFQYDDICRVCHKKLQAGYSSSDGPNSILYSYILLLAAIRNLAEMDGDIESWKEYWMSEPWIGLWEEIEETNDMLYPWIEHK